MKLARAILFVKDLARMAAFYRDGVGLAAGAEVDGDVAAARARLIAHGAVMHEPRPWGACDGVDPEGNVFQITGRRAGASG